MSPARQLTLPHFTHFEQIQAEDPIPADGITPWVQHIIDSNHGPGETKEERKARLKTERETSARSAPGTAPLINAPPVQSSQQQEQLQKTRTNIDANPSVRL